MTSFQSLHFEPIGYFQCPENYTYELPKQGSLSSQNGSGEGAVELLPQKNFEQALEDLQGFSHIWLLYHFHQNENWRPKVLSPRGGEKRGVFSTRAPYRPNGIGMSCVELTRIEGRCLYVQNYDLLNETPILDIKPYVAYADCFPSATQGWLQEEERWKVVIESPLQERINWLEEKTELSFSRFVQSQLTLNPFDPKRKRVELLTRGEVQWSYRTWRLLGEINAENQSIVLKEIYSGYQEGDLENLQEDPYKDKQVHREYREVFTPYGN